MAAPRTALEVSEVVTRFPRVRANGVGHSWHRGLFCSGEDEDSVNVLTHRLRSVGVGASPSDRGRRLAGSGGAAGRSPVADRVAVDTESMTVKADAGVTLRELLDHLAMLDDDLTRPRDGPPGAPMMSFGDALFRGTQRGYTIPAFPWFIDQTVAGAVATATHGSSLRHGSLSSQTTAVTVVLANGTVASYREGDPAFDAVRASVGRLGVVVDVTLRIVSNLAMRKSSGDADAERARSRRSTRVECGGEVPRRGFPRPGTCARGSVLARRPTCEGSTRRRCSGTSPSVKRFGQISPGWTPSRGSRRPRTRPVVGCAGTRTASSRRGCQPTRAATVKPRPFAPNPRRPARHHRRRLPSHGQRHSSRGSGPASGTFPSL